MTTSSSHQQACPNGFLYVFLLCFFIPRNPAQALGLHWSSSEVLWSVMHLIAPNGHFYITASIAQGQLEVMQDSRVMRPGVEHA